MATTTREKKKGQGKGKGNRSYSLEFKLKAIDLAQKTSVKQASESLGIHKATISRWKSRYKETTEDIDNEVVVEVINEIKDRDSKMLDEVYEVKDMIIQRMREIIPTEKNLHNLHQCLKTLADISNPKGADEIDKQPITNVYQLVNQHLTAIENGKDKSTPEGDSAK